MTRIFFFMCIIIFSTSCKSDDKPGDTEITLKLGTNSIVFSANGESQTVKVTTNAETFEIRVPDDAKGWCSARAQEEEAVITATRNELLEPRSTTVTIVAGGKEEKVAVSQSYTTPPAEADTKIKVTGGQASSQETASADNKFANSYDGDYSTIWHTNYGDENKFPITLTYELEEINELNYMVYHPRSDGGGNGRFGQIEIHVRTQASGSFVKVMDYNCDNKGTESKIMFANPVLNPKAVRIIIKSGQGGHGSCAEMEFFRGTGQEVNVGTEIPLGGNTFVSVAGSNGSVTDNGLTKWSDPETVFSTFFRVNRAGELKLYLKYRENTTESEIEVTCNGQVFPVKLPRPESRDAFAYIGTLDNVSPGYIRVDLKGVSRDGDIYAMPTALAVDGTASRGMTYVSDKFSYYWGRRGPSVHMNYTLPAEDCEYFYNEVTVPEGMDPIGSYYMSNGFSGGYYGIQVNTPTERRVLFSVWSPYETDDPTTIPEEYRVKVVKTGEGVKDNDFGNEGSGGQTYLIYDWKAGVAYRFLTRIRPADNDYSEYTSWFYAPEEGKWRLISQLLRPKTQTYYKGAHSFLENFNNQMGHLTRKAYYNNQWVYTKAGNWIELTEGKFSVDSTGDAGWRLDFKGGSDNSGFFLQNCGFFDDTVPKGTMFNRDKKNTPPNIPWDELD